MPRYLLLCDEVRATSRAPRRVAKFRLSGTCVPADLTFTLGEGLLVDSIVLVRHLPEATYDEFDHILIRDIVPNPPSIESVVLLLDQNRHRSLRLRPQTFVAADRVEDLFSSPLRPIAEKPRRGRYAYPVGSRPSQSQPANPPSLTWADRAPEGGWFAL